MSRTKNPVVILFCAVALGRLLTVFTHFGWSHPDEWYQTVELGNYIAHGFMSFTEAMSLQYRNLTWPTLLAGIINISDRLSQNDIAIRLLAIRFLTVLMDLSALWAQFVWVKTKKDWSKNTQLFVEACLILPWFFFSDVSRPSQEHLSVIAFWWSVSFFATSRLLGAGIATSLIFAFKYPSGLLSLGIFLAVLIQFFCKKLSRQTFLKFIAGLLLGGVLGGLADAWIYGRPYHSLWMYLQYNVFTEMGKGGYGTQAAWVYWIFFKDRWFLTLFPIGWIYLAALPLGFWEALKRLEPYVFAAICFLIGNLLIGHKEPRFMTALEPALILMSSCGALRLVGGLRFRTYLKPILASVLLVNGALSIRAIWGSKWNRWEQYQSVGRLINESRVTGPICAVVTIVRPMSTYLPWQTADKVPEPALGFFPVKHRDPVVWDGKEWRDYPVIWQEYAPRCEENERVLIHLPKPHDSWIEQGKCEELRSGMTYWFNKVPSNWVSGAWYRCPSSILSKIYRQEIRKNIGRRMDRYDHLPALGTSLEQLKQIEKSHRDKDQMDATMVDY